MLKIGITGGIGSGKTTVCKVFELLGVPVFYADDIAKSIMNTDSVLKDGIIRAFDQWIMKHSNAAYVIKEAALLFESDSYKMCDLSILVVSPIESRIKRVQARDGISSEDVQLRIDRQFNDEQKMKLADYILMNDEQQLLIPQIINLHTQFLKNPSRK